MASPASASYSGSLFVSGRVADALASRGVMRIEGFCNAVLEQRLYKSTQSEIPKTSAQTTPTIVAVGKRPLSSVKSLDDVLLPPGWMES